MSQYNSKAALHFNQPNLPAIRIQSPEHHKYNIHPPRSPHSSPQHLLLNTNLPKNAILARTNSQTKQSRKTSLQKSKEEKNIQKDIKFAKIKTQPRDQFGPQNRNEITFYEGGQVIMSDFNSLQDSIQTIQKHNYRSTSKSGKPQRQHSASRKQHQMHQAMSEHCLPNVDRKKQEQYYAYWKQKAHEYLQYNMKLMQQMSNLARQNEKLKQQIQTMKSKESVQSKQVDVQKEKGDVYEIMRNSNIYYMNKLQQLERQLKSKEVIIQSFNRVIKDQGRLISGDSERINLMNKMKQEIAYLHAQIAQLSQELYQIKYKDMHQHKQKPKQKEQYARNKAKPKEVQYKR